MTIQSSFLTTIISWASIASSSVSLSSAYGDRTREVGVFNYFNDTDFSVPVRCTFTNHKAITMKLPPSLALNSANVTDFVSQLFAASRLDFRAAWTCMSYNSKPADAPVLLKSEKLNYWAVYRSKTPDDKGRYPTLSVCLPCPVSEISQETIRNLVSSTAFMTAFVGLPTSIYFVDLYLSKDKTKGLT